MLISSVKFFQPIFDLSLCNRVSHPKIMGNNSLVRGVSGDSTALLKGCYEGLKVAAVVGIAGLVAQGLLFSS